MKNEVKTIYVIGGTNGVGKSAWYAKIVKEGTPYINEDFVAKDLAGGKRADKQHYATAHEICTGKIKSLLAEGRSFAFEHNMHVESNYEWLKHIQQSQGYQIMFFYFGVGNLDITTKRIEERMKNGDHYVPPEQVAERLDKGILLLEKYYNMPDKLTLIDNTNNPVVTYQLVKGQVVYQNEQLPGWVNEFAEKISARKLLAEEIHKKTGEKQEAPEKKDKLISKRIEQPQKEKKKGRGI